LFRTKKFKCYPLFNQLGGRLAPPVSICYVVGRAFNGIARGSRLTLRAEMRIGTCYMLWLVELTAHPRFNNKLFYFSENPLRNNNSQQQDLNCQKIHSLPQLRVSP